MLSQFSLNRYKYQYRKKNIKAKNIVWIFCTPKSGSTFFMTYLISNLKESFPNLFLTSDEKWIL